MKTVILIRHNCSEESLRSLNALTVRAYATHIGARFIDLSFLDVPPLRQAISLLRAILKPKAWIMWRHESYVTLPPTGEVPAPLKPAFETSYYLFLNGWNYHNPVGLVQYRSRLLPAVPKTFDIGIYIRQKPHMYFPNGEFLVPPKRMEEVAEEYLRERGLGKDAVSYVLVSDMPLPDTLLPGAKRVITSSVSEAVKALSSSKVVIGANLPICKLAAYTADAPHIVATNMPVDWEHYRGKDRYFENKYATLVVGFYEND